MAGRHDHGRRGRRGARRDAARDLHNPGRIAKLLRMPMFSCTSRVARQPIASLQETPKRPPATWYRTEVCTPPRRAKTPAAAEHPGRAREPGRGRRAARRVGRRPAAREVGVRRRGPRECDAGLLRLQPQFVVEIPHHLDMVGDETDRADDHRVGACLGQSSEVIADVGLQPRHLRRSGPRLPNLVIVLVARGRGDELGGICHLSRVEVCATTRSRPRAESSAR